MEIDAVTLFDAETSGARTRGPRTEVDYANLTNDQLHQSVLQIRENFYNRYVETKQYAIDVLVPVCEAIIARYKMSGVAAANRPNGKPTVEAYFKSINLNYNTVKSWIYREKHKRGMFGTSKRMLRDGTTDGANQDLTHLEAKLLGSAAAAHDLVKAIKQNGNVDEAIKTFEAAAPTPQRIEEYVEHRIEKLPGLVMGLVRDVESYFSDPSPLSMQNVRAVIEKIKSEIS